jgi:hypothetical protein
MKKILTIILLLILASTLTACPETETVYGWALGRSGDVFYGLKGVRIHLAADGFAGADAVTNTFGYYAPKIHIHRARSAIRVSYP